MLKNAPPSNQPTRQQNPRPIHAKPAKPSTLLHLQTRPVRDTAIAKLFDKPATIKWAKVFKGRIDDGAMVDVSLGFDGKNCRGYITYAKSRTRFRLEGTMDSTGFQLEERDMARALTGTLRGAIQGRHLEAEWSQCRQYFGSRIEADEVPPGQSTTLNCSDNKWSSRYITRYNNARCDMVLVRSQNGALDGFLWVEADGRTYKLKGELKADGGYEMEALGSADRLVAMLSGSMKARPEHRLQLDGQWRTATV